MITKLFHNLRQGVPSVWLLLVLIGCRADSPVDPQEQLTYSAPTVFVPTGLLKGPQGIAVDKSGNIWVADTENDLVRKYSPAGAQVDSILGFPRPGYMGMDRFTNDILFISNARSVVRINTQLNTATEIVRLQTNQVDGSNGYDISIQQILSRPIFLDELGDLAGAPGGDIFISGRGNTTDNYVIRLRGTTAGAIVYSTELPPSAADNGTRPLALDRFGTVFTSFVTAESGGGKSIRLYTINPASVQQTRRIVQPSVSSGARGATIDDVGNLFVADVLFRQISIISTATERTLNAITVQNVSGIQVPVPRDVAVSPDGSVYFTVSDFIDNPARPGAIMKSSRVSP